MSTFDVASLYYKNIEREVIMKKLTTLLLIFVLRISYLLTALTEKMLGSIRCALSCIVLTFLMLLTKRPRKFRKISYCIN